MVVFGSLQSVGLEPLQENIKNSVPSTFLVDKILKTKINRNLTEGNKNSIQEKEERKAFYEKKTDQKKTLIRNSFDLPHHQIPTEGNMTREAVARVAAAENSCSSREQADRIPFTLVGCCEDHHHHPSIWRGRRRMSQRNTERLTRNS